MSSKPKALKIPSLRQSQLWLEFAYGTRVPAAEVLEVPKRFVGSHHYWLLERGLRTFARPA